MPLPQDIFNLALLSFPVRSQSSDERAPALDDGCVFDKDAVRVIAIRRDLPNGQPRAPQRSDITRMLALGQLRHDRDARLAIKLRVGLRQTTHQSARWGDGCFRLLWLF